MLKITDLFKSQAMSGILTQNQLATLIHHLHLGKVRAGEGYTRAFSGLDQRSKQNMDRAGMTGSSLRNPLSEIDVKGLGSEIWSRDENREI